MNVLIAEQDIYIHGPYAYLPERIVDNETLIELTKSEHPKQLIGFSTGIRQRHWASEKQACSDLAIEACQQLFEAHPNLKPEIRQLVLATISGDYISPPTSPHVLYELGITQAGAVDLGAACAGFVTGLHTASSLALGTKQAILLVASEIRSKFLNFEDFASSVLFGDGAASIVISKHSENADFKFIASSTWADGEIYDTISIPAGGSRNPIQEETPLKDTKITVKNNAGLFVKAVSGMTDIAGNLLAELKLDAGQIDWLVPHQGNKHLVHSVAKQLGIPLEKTVQSVTTSGNTSGASNGIALAELREQGVLKPGNLLLLTAAGGGGFSASAVLEVV